MATRNARRYYVYTLSDPSDGSIFYVGKGSGNRVHRHEAECRLGVITNPAKHQRIRAIMQRGQSVQADIVADSLSEAEAYKEERRLIGKIGLASLTNARPGQSLSSERVILEAREGIATLLSGVFSGRFSQDQSSLAFGLIRELREAIAIAEN